MSEAYAKFDDFYYNRGGFGRGVNVPQGMTGSAMTLGGDGRVRKANNIFQMGSTTYIDPKYSAMIPEWMIRYRNNFSLLPKTDYSVLGDALKAFLTDPATVTDVVKGVVETDAIFDTGDLPALATVNGSTSVGIIQKIIQAHWSEGLLFKLKQAGFQNDPRFDSAALKAYFTNLWISTVDQYTLRYVDTAPGNDLTSIDQLISGKAEATALTLTTDVDFFGLDRHTSATNADAQMDVSATVRPLDLPTIDDVLVAQAAHNPTDVYSVTHGELLNRWERLISAKQQFIGKSRAIVTREGVQTRQGEDVGFQITTYSGGGISDIPVFGDNAVNQGASGKGTIYFIDGDDMEFRTGMPQTYWETPNDAFGLIGASGQFATRNLLAVVGEVVCSNPPKHGKITAVE